MKFQRNKLVNLFILFSVFHLFYLLFGAAGFDLWRITLNALAVALFTYIKFSKHNRPSQEDSILKTST